MKAITAFLEDFDFAKLLPELGKFMSDLRLWIGIALAIGPLIMLILGLCYYFLPTRQANHTFGFRTYFAMGSKKAWAYTQKLAGLLFMITGGILTVAAIVTSLIGLAFSPMTLAVTAVIFMCAEVAVILGVYVFIHIRVSSKFDREGNPK